MSTHTYAALLPGRGSFVSSPYSYSSSSSSDRCKRSSSSRSSLARAMTTTKTKTTTRFLNVFARGRDERRGSTEQTFRREQILSSSFASVVVRSNARSSRSSSSSSSVVANAAVGKQQQQQTNKDTPTKKKNKKEKREKKPVGEVAKNLFAALKPVRLQDDDSEAASELKAILELARSRPKPNETWTDVQWRIQEEAQKKVGSSIAKYWKAKFAAFGESEAVKDAAPLLGSAVNVAITGLVLRIFLPRLAALNAVGGFDELAEFFGIPPRDDLIGYLDQINGQPMIVIFGIYVLLFFAEKVTMTDEFLPIGFVLPVLSPMVFGNVFNGTMLTSLASTIAASANFWLGRTVLREKALNFKWFSKDGEPTKDRKWYQALDRRFNSENFPDQVVPEGFKSALLLRLCPILPIPISGNWYVCGVTKLKYWEFFAAHFIGSSKTAFIDAYLGSIILRTILSPEVDGVTGAVKEQAKNAVIFETCALLGVSILVSTYATQLFTDILDEEGVDADSFGFGNKEEENQQEDQNAEQGTKTNAFAFVGAAAASSDDDDKNEKEEDEDDEEEDAPSPTDKKLNRSLPGESFDLMSTDEDGEVFINAGDYLSRQRALESGDFDALADMDKAFEKLSEVDDMGPDM